MFMHNASKKTFIQRLGQVRCIALSLSLCLVLAPVQGASTGTTFNVTATVANSCAVTATDMGFGTYDPASAVDKSATSTITVTCTLGTTHNLGLDNGTNASGSTRRMGNGATRLTYGVYKDAAATTVLGSVAATLGITGIGTGIGIPTVIYGVIPKAQNVNAGAYSDQITVTVDY
jgi:spore coat protein U-like protein